MAAPVLAASIASMIFGATGPVLSEAKLRFMAATRLAGAVRRGPRVHRSGDLPNLLLRLQIPGLSIRARIRLRGARCRDHLSKAGAIRAEVYPHAAADRR